MRRTFVIVSTAPLVGRINAQLQDGTVDADAGIGFGIPSSTVRGSTTRTVDVTLGNMPG